MKKDIKILGLKSALRDLNTDVTETDSALATKQDTLVSGTNIKTINSESLLGSGNIAIESGGGSFTDLDDVPASYSGEGNKFVKVNAGETALEFATLAGGGDMLASVYDPTNVAADVFDTDNHVDGTTNKVFTATEKTKLAGIETGATKYPDTGEEVYSSAEKTKLAGIATGAEVNVNADWNAVAGDALILNKPSIPSDGDLYHAGTGDEYASYHTEKTTPVTGDRVLMEDSEDSYNKTYTPLSKLPISTLTQTAIDAKVSDDAYGAGWNGVTTVAPSKNAVYDKIESMGGGVSLSDVYPVGSIYISVVSTNPGTLFGMGTWTAFGAGRVLVGIDAGQTEFDTVEETGGAKTHTLTESEIPSHSHTQTAPTSASGGALRFAVDTNASGAVTDGNATGTTGGGGAHNNLQPYIVVYMWERTA